MYLKEPKLDKVPFLIFANKQDVNGAVEPNEIMQKLELQSINNRPWSIYSCVATQGTGTRFYYNKF
jgi:signal recognition particle receptor subunit beta